jgi:Bacterial Ig-like domain (group 3)
VNVLNRWTRSAVALVAAVAPLAIAVTIPATAGAAPVRTATTTTYTDTTFLQDALGLPTTDTSPVIESVTYDRFQWLLGQPGNFAFLIGDPATDATFAARAQDVEAAAKAAGVKKVYWFDPNLSGNAKVGNTTEPNLDIRNPAGITSLAAASQATYGNAWLSVIGLYLGDGVTAVPHNLGTENATVTITTATATVNDAGLTAGSSTEVGNTSGGALYDYSSGSAPANVSHSFFFIYNQANTQGGQPAKIVSWADLTAEASSSSTQADVTTAIGTVGAANLAQVDQFAWWKSAGNAKEVTQAPSNANGGDVPLLTDSANNAADGGWRVDQITYPELVDLLKSSTGADAVILFGGTWCPNTRPVLPFVNKYAQQNNVTVFNFDTVLDGGTVGGGTTSSSDPLQSRNSAASGATTNANPTFLYGDLVKQYLKNIVTQYNPTVGDGLVTYYPGGNTASALTTVNKLQVPFLIGYQANSSTNSAAKNGGGVVRQWIQQNADVSGLPYYTEYMSSWWYTNPQPNELGISTIPLDAPIWSTLNAELASFTWQTDPTTLYPNTAIDTDDAQYLDGADTATVKYTAAAGSTPASVTVTSGGASPIPISPTALSLALAAVGTPAPANLAAAKTALIAAEVASPQNPTLISNLSTVVGAWGVAQQRKSKVISAWGAATNPGSLAGGATAVHALDVFFAGLPGGVVSRQTVTADSVTAGTAPKITIAISNDFGRLPTGNVSLVVKQGGATVASASTAVSKNTASFTLPALAAGTYAYTLSYPGDDQILAFTNSGSLTVSPAAVVSTTTTTAPAVVPVSEPAVPVVTGAGPTTTKPSRTKASIAAAVIKAPTATAAGKYKVTIVTPKGHPKATGKVTIKVKNGSITKTITAKLSGGAVTVSVPKLAHGTWKVAISWAGDSNYLAASATGTSIRVAKTVTK